MKKISLLVLLVLVLVMTVMMGMSCNAQQPAQTATVEETTVEVPFEEVQAQITTLIYQMEAKSLHKKFLALLLPAGGEWFIKGETYTVAWSSIWWVDEINIELENWEGLEDWENIVITREEVANREGGPGPLVWIIAENVSASLKQYSWTIPENIQPGNCYTIRIVDSSDTPPYNQQMIDSNDGYFSIVERDK